MKNNPSRLAVLLALCIMMGINGYAQGLDADASPANSNQFDWEWSYTALSQIPGSSVDPYYTGFWILGDGTYKIETIPNATSSGTSTFTHAYAQAAATYNGVIYLTERYSDTEPPARMYNDNAVISPSFTPQTPTQQGNFLGSEFIRIDTNHHIIADEDKYNLFAVVYRPEESTVGKVYFFYNHKLGSGPDAGLDYQKTELPDYSSPANLDATTTPSGWDSNWSSGNTDFGGRYDAALAYIYDDSEPRYSGYKKDLRLFPVMHPADTLTVNDQYECLALLTGPQGSEVDPYLESRPGWDTLVNLLGNLVKNNLVKFPTGVEEPEEYLIDFAFTTQTIVPPTDPNSICIKEVCRCNNGVQVITYELEFCNVGEGPAQDIQILVKDINDYHEPCIQSTDPQVQFVNISGEEWLIKYQHQGGTTNVPGGECRSFTFSLINNAAGQATNDMELAYCVEFVGVGQLCGLLSDDPACVPIESKLRPYIGACASHIQCTCGSCILCEKFPWLCHPIVITGLVLLLIAGLYLLFRKKTG